MAKIYIITSGEYSDYCIQAVFSTKKKADEYREDLEHDPKPVIKRCGSVGLIVLAAFFNNLALVFIIINFVRTKTCRHIIDKL